MPKQIMNDVIPPREARSVRNIPVPPRAYRWSGNDELREEEQDAPPPRPLLGGRGGAPQSAHRARWLLWSIVLIALAGMGIAVLVMLNGATVTVTLKSVPVEVSLDGTATNATTTVDVFLPYTAMTIKKTESATVEPEGMRHTERKASGTIIIYNNFSSAPQRLIKNTRFETSSGLIYRIQDSLVVPGQTKTGSKTVPGSVEAMVYADQAGASYNIGLTDFTIPGFKTSPDRYAAFYARSKTAMDGGFVGDAPYASADKISAAHAALRKTIESALRANAAAQAPVGSVILNGGYAFVSAPEPESETADKKLSVGEQGTIIAFAFDRANLATYLARRAVPRYDGAPVLYDSTEDLSFTFLNKSDYGKTGDGKVLFTLQGTGTITWTLDEARLKTALAGKAKSETVAVLASYPAVERSQVVIRPFWHSSFPNRTDRISIVISKVTTPKP